MTFVKLVKNKAYFKRFQVKLRRRREGKTNYRTRKILISQDKNKYNSKKHRFVVRVTSSKVICQVVYATLNGDYVMCAADSSELVKYGIPVGLTNYAACYATGLLLARRLLKQLGMDENFKGIETANGEAYNPEEDITDKRPFKCFLDVGIIRTTKGNRVFGALKGACDGGLNIPHSTKKFFGSSGDSYDAEAHRGRIFGVHVANYMKTLQDEDPDKYQEHFSQYIKNNIEPDSIEDMYANCHKKIRDNPEHIKVVKPKIPVVKEGNVIKTSKGSYVHMKKLTTEQRKSRVAQKLKILQEQLEANSNAE